MEEKKELAEVDRRCVLENGMFKLRTVATILGALDTHGTDFHLEGPDFTGLFHIIEDTCRDIEIAFWGEEIQQK